jgi:glycogen operon protein
MGHRDVSWFAPDGTTMSEEKWHNPQARYLTVRLSPTRRDEPPLLVMLNAAAEDMVFKVPQSPTPRWRLLLDTAEMHPEGEHAVGGEVTLAARSLLLMEAAG